MPKGPPYLPFGYGPWPDNDVMGEETDPSPHYRDGYHNRAPGGAHIEGPTDLWIDRIVYPRRLEAVSDMEADRMDARSRDFRITVGQVTGRKPGPEE